MRKLALRFPFDSMILWMAAKHKVQTQKIEFVTHKTILAEKLTAQSEKKMLYWKSFANFFDCTRAYFCCVASWITFINKCMQSMGTKPGIIYMCGAHLQEAVQNWVGQDDFGNLLHQISHFLNKKFRKNGEIVRLAGAMGGIPTKSGLDRQERHYFTSYKICWY